MPTNPPPIPTTGPPPYAAPDRPIPDPAVQWADPVTTNVFNITNTEGEILTPFRPTVGVLNGYVAFDDIASIAVWSRGRDEFGFGVTVKGVPQTLADRPVATGFETFEAAAEACDEWVAEVFGIVGPKATHRRL